MQSYRRLFLKKLSLGTLGLGIPLSKLWPMASNGDRFSTKGVNPWLEISKNAYLHNAEIISKMAKGTAILAVLKNNAYGIGDVEVAKILDESPHIHGFAFVKETRCLALRKAGVKKPILLMGDFATDLGEVLIKEDITLSIFSKESLKKIMALPKHDEQKIKVQLYFDTGLGRMGIPYDADLDWIKELAQQDHVSITGLFSTLTTPPDFAKEQIKRFKTLANELAGMGIKVEHQHVAPSLSLLDLEESYLNLVRPGILLHGSFPLLKMSLSKQFPLRPTYRLRARVIRMELLKKGDTIGFSRFYKIPEDQWIATIPIGWAEGYSSAAENGAKVLINDKLFTVVNVNSSHCNVMIGKEKQVEVGETATLIGPDAPEITPEGFAQLIDGHNYLQINYKESLPKYVFDDFD
ncbi:alanine racemase [Flagellimonas sp. CMM7]|uniref:alanine racemase n=1 Tax=Flagellimonas sp. CMM7 TaxID=2654676 RepID=UPI0013D24039|nr:alanine racemase [Flagellimonas sp. CMM7]UII81318.1 alanine racemase [Flagellimonas sp. CMM7]